MKGKVYKYGMKIFKLHETKVDMSVNRQYIMAHALQTWKMNTSVSVGDRMCANKK